jgi:hypothetical protein
VALQQSMIRRTASAYPALDVRRSFPVRSGARCRVMCDIALQIADDHGPAARAPGAGCHPLLSTDGIHGASESVIIQRGWLHRTNPAFGVDVLLAAMNLVAMPPQIGFATEWQLPETLPGLSVEPAHRTGQTDARRGGGRL